MTANVWDPRMRAIDEQYPGILGNLVSPDAWRRQLSPRYALDNGRFVGKRVKPRPWSAKAYLKSCDRAMTLPTPPRFITVPDVYGDLDATLREWERWAPVLRRRYPGVPLAVVWQPPNSPSVFWPITVFHSMFEYTDAEVQFLGGPGNTRWRLAPQVGKLFPRMHVGRVNSPNAALRAYRCEAESVDGTGWCLTDRQRKGMIALLDTLARGETHLHPPLIEESAGT